MFLQNFQFKLKQNQKMKVKTNFKKMYLIDANVYDRMNFNSMSQNSPQRQSSSSKSSISIDQHALPHNSNYQSIRSFSGKNEPFNPLFPKDQSNHDRIVNEKKTQGNPLSSQNVSPFSSNQMAWFVQSSGFAWPIILELV